MTTPGQRLGREIAGLRQRVKDLEDGQRARQLPFASLDDGYLRLGAGGTDRGKIGMHVDGTVAVTYANGPKPATPTAPTLSATELGLVVYWDGAFDGGTPRPSDVLRVDIHEDETSGFAVDGSTIKSSLPGEGARLLVLDNQPHHVKLVAVSNAGVASDPSSEASATPLPVSDLAAGAVTADQLEAELFLATQIIAAKDFFNRTTNPSFENDVTTGWSEWTEGSTPGTLTVERYADSGTSYGDYVCRIGVTDMGTPSENAAGIISDHIDVEPNTPYTVSCALKLYDEQDGGDAWSFFVRLSYYDADGNHVQINNEAQNFYAGFGDPSPIPTTFTDYDYAEHTVYAPPEAATARARLYFRGQNDDGTTYTSLVVGVDAAMIYRGQNSPVYVDGDQANAFWEGTPHASRSYMEAEDIQRRVSYDTDGFHAYGLDGSVLAEITAEGDVNMVGRLRTALSGNRVELTRYERASNRTVHGLLGYPSWGTWDHPAMIGMEIQSPDDPDFRAAHLFLQAPEPDGSNASHIQVGNEYINLYAHDTYISLRRNEGSDNHEEIWLRTDVLDIFQAGSGSTLVDVEGRLYLHDWETGKPAVLVGGNLSAHLEIDRDSVTSWDDSTTQGTLRLNDSGTTETGLLHVTATADATTGSGNAPPLRVGDTAGDHLRIDGNEIIRMSGDSTQGRLMLNPGGTVLLGTGSNVGGMDWSRGGYDFGTDGIVRIPHNLGSTPSSIFVSSDNDARQTGGRDPTASDFEARISNSDGTAATGTQFISWLVIL